MIAEYTDRTFKDLRSIRLTPMLTDMTFVRCQFQNCVLSTEADPTQRAVLRNVVLREPRVTGSTIGGALMQDCTLENLHSQRFEILYGCAFEHVTLKGKMGRLWLRGLSPAFVAGVQEPDLRLVHAYEDANARFYETIDWALDICEVVTRKLRIDGVPAHLIRRDPLRHVVVRREAAIEGRWRAHGLRATPLRYFIEGVAKSDVEAQVFVIPDMGSARGDIITVVRQLQEDGIVDAG